MRNDRNFIPSPHSIHRLLQKLRVAGANSTGELKAQITESGRATGGTGARRHGEAWPQCNIGRVRRGQQCRT